MKTIVGKTVLLTGASRGIGAFIARALVKEQATVVGVSRSKLELEEFLAEVTDMGYKAYIFPYDISKVEKLSILVEEINQLVGPIDILINNAAIEKYRVFQDYSLEDIQSVLVTNIIAAMELTRLVLPNMLSRGSGHIVNIASLSGKKGIPYNSIYSASKAGLLVWTDAIRQELAETNVGVSIICPGYVASGMFAETGMTRPSLANMSTPTEVAIAIIRAIKQNQPELILDGGFTKLLFAIGQLFPHFGDAVFRWLGITRKNKVYATKCVKEEVVPKSVVPQQSVE
jgi:short-subunit dehydrogenase